MFCDLMPFTIQSALLATTPYNTSQMTPPIGPFLTENRITDPIPTLTPPNLVPETGAPWTYRFVRGSKGQILIYASDGAGGMGWLSLKSNTTAWNRKTSFLLPSQALAEALGVQWGVVFQNNTVGTGVNTQVFLPYVDSSSSDVLLMTCIGGNTSSGLVPCDQLDTTSTTAMYHGAYNPSSDNISANSAFFAHNFLYNPVSMAAMLNTVNLAETGLASWVLAITGGAPSLADVGYYMQQVCMGVVSENCYGNAPKCTNFTSLTPRGLSCLAAARIDSDVTNAAYQTLCGINPVTKTPLDAVPDANSAVRSTPDCMCINYSQSPFPQPGLPDNSSYSQFQEWVASNDTVLKSSGNTMCWLPSCIASNGTGAITYDWPQQFPDPTKYTGKCPNSLYCIGKITAAIENNASVTLNTLNECSQSSNNGPSQAPAKAPVKAPAPKKLTDSIVFRAGVAAMAIMVITALTYFLFKPLDRPAVRYVVI